MLVNYQGHLGGSPLALLWSPPSFDASGDLAVAVVGSYPMPMLWLWAPGSLENSITDLFKSQVPKENYSNNILNCPVFEFPKYIVFNATQIST